MLEYRTFIKRYCCRYDLLQMCPQVLGQLHPRAMRTRGPTLAPECRGAFLAPALQQLVATRSQSAVSVLLVLHEHGVACPYPAPDIQTGHPQGNQAPPDLYTQSRRVWTSLSSSSPNSP